MRKLGPSPWAYSTSLHPHPWDDCVLFHSLVLWLCQGGVDLSYWTFERGGMRGKHVKVQQGKRHQTEDMHRHSIDDWKYRMLPIWVVNNTAPSLPEYSPHELIPTPSSILSITSWKHPVRARARCRRLSHNAWVCYLEEISPRPLYSHPGFKGLGWNRKKQRSWTVSRSFLTWLLSSSRGSI